MGQKENWMSANPDNENQAENTSENVENLENLENQVEGAEKELLDIASEVEAKIEEVNQLQEEMMKEAGGEDAWKDQLIGVYHNLTFTSKSEHINRAKMWMKEFLEPKFLAARAIVGAAAGMIASAAFRGVAHDIKGTMGSLDDFATWVNSPKPGAELFYDNPTLIVGGICALAAIAGPIKNAIESRLEISRLKKQEEMPYREWEARYRDWETDRKSVV